MSLKSTIRRLLRNQGWDLMRFLPARHPDARIRRLLELHAIDLVLDVGANVGQYGQSLRELGYTGRIVSFEPLSSAFSRLGEAAAEDPDWEARRCALGGETGEIEINIAGNSQSSSILDMLPEHTGALPSSRYVGKEKAPLRRLDDEFAAVRKGARRVMLKLDTQGYELHVLGGGVATLAAATLVEVEMSLVALYEGAPTFLELHQILTDRGFVMASIEPVFSDPATGRLLQVDGVYLRQDAPAR
jgi:FkbM family methyltransferase